MEASGIGISCRCLESPMARWVESNSSRRAQSLRNSRPRSYSSPCSQVFGDRFHVQMVREPVGEANVGSCIVVFDSHWRELLIIRSPSGHQSSLPPWLPNTEVNGARQGPRMNVAFGERSNLADEIAASRHHIED